MARFGPKPRPVAERFWEKVDKSGECWMWTGSSMGAGYGKFCYDGKSVGAHRVSWMLVHGSIADGMEVCHRCDTPRCVRPSHLFVAPHAENVRDMVEKGRQYTRPMPGGSNGRAKLSVDAVRSIRARCVSPATARELAKEYGVTTTNIRHIVQGKTWKNT